MTHNEISRIKDLYASGYTENQIASILMIHKEIVISTLEGDLIVEKTGIKGKIKPQVEDNEQNL